MAKMIRIVAKRDGFRRCGVRHSASGADHPTDQFSKDEMKILLAEPMLVVHEVEVPDGKAKGGGKT